MNNTQTDSCNARFFHIQTCFLYPSCSGCPCILPAFSISAVQLFPFPFLSVAQLGASHTALTMTCTYKAPSKSILTSPINPVNILEHTLQSHLVTMPLKSLFSSVSALSPEQPWGILFIMFQFFSVSALGTSFPTNQCI